MILEPDFLIITTLQNGFTGFRSDPTPLAEVFAFRSQAEINDITAYFNSNTPPVRLGFPRSTPEVGLGALYITTGMSKEADEFIGSIGPNIPNDTNIEEAAVIASTNLNITSYSVDVLKVTYLATLAKWILLKQRLNLETTYGLMDQKISLTDILPAPQWFPDFAFRRQLTYSCTHVDWVEGPIPSGDVDEIIIRPEASVDPTFQFIID